MWRTFHVCDIDFRSGHSRIDRGQCVIFFPGMKVLICGHSFVRNFRTFLCQQSGCWEKYQDFSNFLGLPEENIFVHGKGGLKANAEGFTLISNYLDLYSPDVLVLELGTNDVCARSSSGPRVAEILIRQCQNWLNICANLKSIVIVKITNRRRLHVSHEIFETRKEEFNRTLVTLARSNDRIYAFGHDRAAIRAMRTDLAPDGIHVTSNGGMRLYNFSVRKAVLIGLRRARRHDY